MNAQDLARRHCTPLEGHGPMPLAEIDRHLAALPGWSFVHGAIQKSFDFADFEGTMAFVNAVAGIARREDHHPDMAVSYSRCTLRWNTHSVGGVSINDFICAAQADALAAT